MRNLKKSPNLILSELRACYPIMLRLTLSTPMIKFACPPNYLAYEVVLDFAPKEGAGTLSTNRAAATFS